MNRTNVELLGRRLFLQSAMATGAYGCLSWRDAVMLKAGELRQKGMSCILLFMRGGLSQLESFDPKPRHPNGGGTKAISTSVPGVQIAEAWPETAKVQADIGLIRSVTNAEGEHDRAVYQMHTGYTPIATTQHPGFGATVSTELAVDSGGMPSFVGLDVPRRTPGFGPGFLSPRYAPLVAFGGKLPRNLKPPGDVDANRLDKRLALMRELEKDYASQGREEMVRRHQELYRQTAQLMQSRLSDAFQLTAEPASVHQQYGDSRFGQNCLLARRLVELGVTFVEVELNGWDTHTDHFNRIKSLNERADRGFAALVADLKARSMLDRTLVILLTEFGRSPRINSKAGRDHHAKAFSVALAGGGVQGGRVIGATTKGGVAVAERPVKIPDLFCTFCHSLGINPAKEKFTPLQRPVNVVDGGSPVLELFG